MNPKELDYPKRLNTPKFKRLNFITGDGGFTELNREIHNSMGRVKAAKFGVMNKEITPFHN